MSDNPTTATTSRSVVEAYGRAWLAGDTLAVVSMYHDDLELLWPGKHHLAGVHQGQAASIDALLALQVLTNRVPLEIVDILEGEHSAMLVVIERWSTTTDAPGSEANQRANPRNLDVRRALEFSVVDGKLRRGRIYEADEAAIDEWLTKARARNQGVSEDE